MGELLSHLLPHVLHEPTCVIKVILLNLLCLMLLTLDLNSLRLHDNNLMCKRYCLMCFSDEHQGGKCSWSTNQSHMPTLEQGSKIMYFSSKTGKHSCGAHSDTSHEFDDFKLGITLNPTPMSHDRGLTYDLKPRVEGWCEKRIKHEACVMTLESLG